MAENINFIPATELPEAIGDDVSVICLENGELRQKPGASIGGGDSLLCRTYTPEDIVLGTATDTNEKCIVDEEIVRAVFQSINNKTKMPYICLFVDAQVYFPQKIFCDFGTDLNARAFGFSLEYDSTVPRYFIFDTYDNAYDFYYR